MVTVFHPANALGAGIGLLADRLLGDPPHRFDPIAAYEQLVARSSEEQAAKAAGITYAALGTALGSVTGWGLRRMTGGLGSASIGAWSVIRGRTRGQRALAVQAALASGDAEAARSQLPAMVRDEAATTADEDLADLTVATVAEEAIDGVVGPALWAAVAGAPGTLVYKGINTLDSLVGHHSDRYEAAGPFGTAVDLAANLVPAYLGAALIAAVRPAAAGDIWQAVRDGDTQHASRSVRVIEAAFAAALGLGPGPDGARRRAEPSDISAAVALSRDLSLAMAGACLAVGGAATIVARWRARASVSGRGR